jgi:FkbH-like protein
MVDLYWLPEIPDWDERLKALAGRSGPEAWPALVGLANSRLDLLRTERVSRALRRLCGSEIPLTLAAPPIRLAVIGSSTLEHLTPGLRAACLRRNLWVDVYTGDYGQYAQELNNPASGLHAFAPTVVLFAVDARHLVQFATQASDFAAADVELDATVERLRRNWAIARGLGAQVIQQTAMPVLPGLVGSNEQRLAWSPRRLVREINARIARAADQDGVDIVSMEDAIERDGLAAWHDVALWHRAKQEIHPSAAHVYGDLVARLIGARLGRSSKCLVLDLDNTLWGGVIGDDGLHGIVLGQGSVAGEAHVALQNYAKALARRGVILAVCSKNDKANALEPFDSHPDMILRRSDVACFIANWRDKPGNLREIAQRLNIGLDALTFVDDNPFERNIVRRELPMVNVPELPDDAVGYVDCLAAAGYFEAVAITADDMQRAEQYQANVRRESARSETDMEGYLESLNMQLLWRPFDKVGLQRIVQLVNKSNQFNLTTRRYSEPEAEALIGDGQAVALQLRLLDAFGDNGMIAVVIGGFVAPGVLEIDTWLMSCRVLGRQVEEGTLNVVIEQARALAAHTLRGVYRPTAKNQMVAQHYAKLGFAADGEGEGGETFWRLDIDGYAPKNTALRTVQENL